MEINEKFSNQDVEKLKEDLDSITRMVEEISKIEDIILGENGEVKEDIDMERVFEVVDMLGEENDKT